MQQVAGTVLPDAEFGGEFVAAQAVAIGQVECRARAFGQLLETAVEGLEPALAGVASKFALPECLGGRGVVCSATTVGALLDTFTWNRVLT